MKQIYLAVAGLVFSAVVPGLLVPAGAETVTDDVKKPVLEESATKTTQPIKTPLKSTPAKMTKGVDPFAVDLKDREFWTKGELKMGVEKWYGDNTYQIGDPTHWFINGLVENDYFPFSELEFPLDVVMFSAQYDLEIKQRWMLSLSFKTDLDHSGDDMEDSDWITPSNPDQLDIFSKSNVTDFEAYEYDVNVKFKYLKGANWSLDGGIGYLFQKYKYDTALKTQYSPSGLLGYDYVWDGRTSSLKYDLSYQIPYVQLGGAVTIAKRVTIIANASYSPIVHAEDEDQHLLRGKVNRGNLDGDSWMVNLETRYQFNRNWFASLEYGYKEISVDGKMKGIFYGDPSLTHTVWEELESTQHSGSLMVGYSY
ncbi:MAG: omptin family outer membrane protease [Proteobacteria bacterium]|nr:omptin family outer membrane protease [Pseudomonadota bacterium]MBU1641022.1 omptin family outer membrane protease [Pseudomonadota bacterium]